MKIMLLLQLLQQLIEIDQRGQMKYGMTCMSQDLTKRRIRSMHPSMHVRTLKGGHDERCEESH